MSHNLLSYRSTQISHRVTCDWVKWKCDNYNLFFYCIDNSSAIHREYRAINSALERGGLIWVSRLNQRLFRISSSSFDDSGKSGKDDKRKKKKAPQKNEQCPRNLLQLQLLKKKQHVWGFKSSVWYKSLTFQEKDSLNQVKKGRKKIFSCNKFQDPVQSFRKRKSGNERCHWTGWHQKRLLFVG